MKHAQGPHRLNGPYTAHGTTFHVAVSPCCWMYKGHPFQITAESADKRSDVLIQLPGRTEQNATAADVGVMLATLEPMACVHCQAPYFRSPDDIKGTQHMIGKGLLCEPCRVEAVRKECDKFKEQERLRIHRQNAKMKGQGFTHKVVAWVHAGGDDRQMEIYYKGEPTARQIQQELRKKRSRVLDDYTVIPL